MLAGTTAGANWDPMEAEGPWPHFTFPHRMMLGWTQASWIKLYDFLASPGTERFLVAVSLGGSLRRVRREDLPPLVQAEVRELIDLAARRSSIRHPLPQARDDATHHDADESEQRRQPVAHGRHLPIASQPSAACDPGGVRRSQ
jgi:hypothetical protein